MRKKLPVLRSAARKGTLPGGSEVPLGAAGETVAVRALARQGYRIVERNYRCRWGEIDIIARDGETLVFVEVKSKRSGKFLSPVFAVTPHKQRTLVKVAMDYLTRKNLAQTPCRFDVVSVIWPAGEDPTWEIITGAFEADPNRV
ncbi:MAG TPA: YraN family protein [bacterium]|nr:YraN family protein [bacterium]